MIFCPTLYLGTKVQFHFTIKNVNNKSVDVYKNLFELNCIS